MKKTKKLVVLILALVTICCIGVTAYAETASTEDIAASDSTFSQDLDSMPLDSELEPLPEVREVTPDTLEIPVEEETPAVLEGGLKQSNTLPYFVGAGIAVIVFIGVAVFCKFKGNR